MAIMFDSKLELVRKELYKIFHEIQDNMNDGFVQWEHKKSLIDVKYIIDNMLDCSSKFGALEAEYIKNKEQQKLIGILKK